MRSWLFQRARFNAHAPARPWMSLVRFRPRTRPTALCGASLRSAVRYKANFVLAGGSNSIWLLQTKVAEAQEAQQDFRYFLAARAARLSGRAPRLSSTMGPWRSYNVVEQTSAATSAPHRQPSHGS